MFRKHIKKQHFQSQNYCGSKNAEYSGKLKLDPSKAGLSEVLISNVLVSEESSYNNDPTIQNSGNSVSTSNRF